MHIFACQCDIAWEDKASTHDRVEAQLAKVDIPHNALVVLPEMFATGFSMHVPTISEATDGPTHQFLSGLAQRLRCYVLGGVVTRSADGRGRNEAVVFNSGGHELARYCKMHPFSFAGEDDHYQAGDDVQIFSWEGVSVAPFVCYDLRFPEAFRVATRRGAQLLVVIANWPEPRDAHWQALLRARAIENQAYVVGVNRCGADPHAAYAGHSLILGPRGETLASAGERPEVLHATLDWTAMASYRAQFPALDDLRADFFAR